MLKINLLIALAWLFLPAAAFAAKSRLAPECNRAMQLRRDEGMWTYNHLPKKHLMDSDKFEVTPEWSERMMKSAVRIGAGGSGSWDSAYGLIVTNQHVAGSALSGISTAERNIAENGFYAPTIDQEIPIHNLEVNQLISIEDVTDKVLAAVKPEMSQGLAKNAIQQAVANLEKDDHQTCLKCQVVVLYLGAQYHLYTYKKYTDIRLVFAPERSIASFGAEVDNFAFPRRALDVTVLRAYEDGKPALIDHYFTWKAEGAKRGELVFVPGNPGVTKRMFTAAQMFFDKDNMLPWALDRTKRRIKNLEAYSLLGSEQKRQSDTTLRNLQNSLKIITGEEQGLQNRKLNLIAKKLATDGALIKILEQRPELKDYISGWDEIKAAEEYKLTIINDYRLFEEGDALDTELFDRARELVRLAGEDQKANDERLLKFQSAKRAELLSQINSSSPIHKDFERRKLIDSLKFMVEKLGPSNALVQLVLEGKSPEERANELIQNTTLDDPAVRRAYVEGGQAIIEESKDPFILLAKALDPTTRELRRKFEDNVRGPESAAYKKIAAARFAVNGLDQYPDATVSPRLAYGRIKGYKENGKVVPPVTTIGEAFEKEKEMGGQWPFKLPASWHAAKSDLDMDTPFNQVITSDTIGGNSGSAVVNRDLQLVGLLFDGNSYSHIARYAYTSNAENPARGIAVHPAAILHTLSVVYKAQALVDELLGLAPPKSR